MATQAELDTKLNLSGGAMTGAITTNSTFDGIDIATRDAVLTSTTTTAGAALPKAGGTMTGHTLHGDAVISKYGASNDLEIYHSTDSYIKDSGDGNLMITSNGAGVFIQGKAGEHSIIANADGAVALYHDNSAKLATSATGVTVTGTVSATATATLLIINSAGSTVKTINGIG
jgi:hypothetical protein